MAKGENTLTALVVDSKDQARALLKRMLEIDAKDNNVKIVDAALVTKSDRGKISLEQTSDLGGGKAGLGGAAISAMAGAIVLGPVGLVAGGIIGGALAGLYGSLRDSGMDNGFMTTLAAKLEPGKTALFVLYQGRWAASSEGICGALAENNATLFFTSLPDEAGDFARECLLQADEEAIAELGIPEAAIAEELAVPPEPAAVEAEAVEAVTTDAPAEVALAAAAAAPVEPAAAQPETPKPAAAPRKKRAPQAEDLTQIRGIGPQIAEVLAAAHIKTFDKLEHTSDATLREILYAARVIPPSSLTTWSKQAGFAARGDWKGLSEFNQKAAASKPKG